jgi:phosphatidylglycerophosphate synthase
MPARWWLTALLAAAATEFLDGQVARLLRAPGTTGKILDPIADKTFVVCVLATLLVAGAVKPWQLILVISRDIVVTAGALWVAARRGISAVNRMSPSAVGKLTTAAQFLFLLAVVATGRIDVPLLIVTAVLSAWAAIDYVLRFR